MGKRKFQLKVSLSKAPYRGIYTEIAREEGLSVPTVYNAVNHFDNERLQAKVMQKITERRNAQRRLRNAAH